ncbi:hypothetical protein DICVIV_13753, partial [Dictyocaulus viviparus]
HHLVANAPAQLLVTYNFFALILDTLNFTFVLSVVATIDDKRSTCAQLDIIQDTDILSRECIKKGVLLLKDNDRHRKIKEWSSHVFILFPDRICYLLETCDDLYFKNDNLSSIEEDEKEEELSAGFGVRPEEQHVTEEWFHGVVLFGDIKISAPMKPLTTVV